MSVPVFLLGLLLIVLVTYDFFYTTLSSHGAGYPTYLLTNFVWRMILTVSKKIKSNRLLRISGMGILLTVLCMWVLMFWIGLFLLLQSDPDAVVDSNGVPAKALDKLYYSGYVLSTMGNGDFKPASGMWQLITSLFSYAGFIFITTAMTYLVSVSSAIIDKRSLGLMINNLGATPQEILINAWNGKDFGQLISHFETLHQQLNRHIQNHMSYPMLHFFHSTRQRDNFALNVVRLDEAISLLLYISEGHDHLNKYDILSLRRSLNFYLNTLYKTFIHATDEVAAVPSIRPLLEHGIPLDIQVPDLEDHFNSLTSRRKILAGLLENAQWRWKDVYYPEIMINDKL